MTDARALNLIMSDVGRGDVFENYMLGYEKVFTLPDESETREGFIDCLRLNHGEIHKTLSSLYGPFREIVAIATAPGIGVIGGVNFLFGPVTDEKNDVVVTVHVNYVYIDPAHRRSGRLRQIIDAMTMMASTAFSEQPVEVVTFLEQNDPLAMTCENYARDSLASGIDQIDRVRAWTRLGARIVDFPYVQPALCEGAGPDDSLMLAALTDAPTLSRRILHPHLRRFFGVSIAKGGKIPRSAERQLDDIASDGSGVPCALIDPTQALETLARLPRRSLPAGNLREYAKDLEGALKREQSAARIPIPPARRKTSPPS